MKTLLREAFERARHFLLHEARPLESSIFQHRFEGAGIEGVLAALSAFQNSDGGFGRALEPDMRSPSSSPLATAIGLQMLSALGCSAGESLVQRAVAYLQTTYQEETGVWRVAPVDVNSYPHAPWWHDQDRSLERTFDEFRIIPRALVLAGLQHYASLLPASWLNRVTEETVDYIEHVPELGGGGGSDLEYVITLAETRGLPRRWARRLDSRIRQVIPSVVVGDPERWGSYCLSPLRVISTPETIGADLIADPVKMHLDYQIDHQSADGTWDPVWSWAEAYPESWRKALQEWRGHLTLKTLMQLSAFKRIEGI
jgi:hypothetical protein